MGKILWLQAFRMCFLWNSFLCMINLFIHFRCYDVLSIITQNNSRIMEHQWKIQCNAYNFMLHFTFVSELFEGMCWTLCFALQNSLPLPTLLSPQETEFYGLNLPLPSGFWGVFGHCQARGGVLKAGGGRGGRPTSPAPCLQAVRIYGKPHLLRVILFWKPQPSP